MSGQHTPGPWEWQTPMGDSAPWIVPAGLQAYEWQPIATLGDCLEDDLPPRGKAHQTIMANARLIAAAPDLLALAYQYASDLRYPVSDDSRQRRLSAIEAAIAKATGA